MKNCAITILMLLAIVGGCLAQNNPLGQNNKAISSSSSATDNSQTKQGPGQMNVSRTCQVALKGPDAHHNCSQMNPNGPIKQYMTKLCSSPADGNQNHFCSTVQINKALDAIENGCKDELKKAQKDVQELYDSWLLYTLDSKAMCVKTDDDKYCFSKMFAQNSTAPKSPSDECEGCFGKIAATARQWEPPRSPDLAGQNYYDKVSNVRKSISRCNAITESSKSSSTSIHIGATTFSLAAVVMLAAITSNF
ncbi:hypothetical protein BDF19DRAFT_425526 [Syncephalis fuscata]|nr:hypothetical protein BDF19DRAFT_425526 [Syncephalis fuscata]